MIEVTRPANYSTSPDGESKRHRVGRRPRLLALGTLAAFAATLSAAPPAISAESGSVDATVTVAGGGGGGCILVGATSVDFGTLPFSLPSSEPGGFAAPYSIANCGQGAASLLGRSTDAIAAEVTWQLPDEFPIDGRVCNLGPNVYFNGVGDATALDPGAQPLSTVDQPLSVLSGGSLAAGGAISVENVVVMPCEGSDGAGQTMSFSFTYTAVAEG